MGFAARIAVRPVDMQSEMETLAIALRVERFLGIGQRALPEMALEAFRDLWISHGSRVSL